MGGERRRLTWLTGRLPPDWERLGSIVVHLNMTLHPANPRHARLLRLLDAAGPRGRVELVRTMLLTGGLDRLAADGEDGAAPARPDLGGLGIDLDGDDE